MSSIRVINLCKTFKVGLKKNINALNNVSFEIPPGEITGYLGPNGSGKTTTFKILTGLNKPTSGEVLINDISCQLPSSRNLLGYLPEGPYFYEYLTGEESLLFYASLFGLKPSAVKKRAHELLDRFGILHG
jgi:ABC-2 type transport system ATP-binding protein